MENNEQNTDPTLMVLKIAPKKQNVSLQDAETKKNFWHAPVNWVA